MHFLILSFAIVFFVKQKTAYVMRISDWSSDVCSSDLPILHGLCTYGIAARAIMERLCDHDPTRIYALDARFTAPVLPGETIVTEKIGRASCGGRVGKDV